MAKPVEKLLQDLRSWWPGRRRAAAEALGWSEDKRAIAPLIRALHDRNPEVRAEAAVALRGLGAIAAVVPVAGLLGDTNSEARQAAARALAGTPSVKSAVSVIRRLAEGCTAAEAAAMIDRHKQRGDWREPLLAAALPPEDSLRRELARALNAVFGQLLAGFNEPLTCASCAAGLADLADPRSIELMVRMLEPTHRGENPSPLGIRSALSTMDSKQTAPPLAQAALGRQIVTNLNADARNILTLATGDRDYVVGSPAIVELLLGCGEEGVDALLRMLDPGSTPQRRACANLFRQYGAGPLGQGILRFLSEGGTDAATAIRALAAEDRSLGWRLVEVWSSFWTDVPSASVERLRALLQHPAPWLRIWAAEAIGRSRKNGAAELLVALWDETAAADPLPAAVGLAYLGIAQGVGVLARGLSHHDREARLAGAHALLRLGRRAAGAMPHLYGALDSEADREVRQVCERAIRCVEDALRGESAELESAPAPAGLGTELEAGVPSAGRGTEAMSADTTRSDGT